MISEVDKLEKRIAKKMGETLVHHQLIKNGDRLLLACSGGKDSLAMVYFLTALQKRSPVSFSFSVYHLDQGHPGAKYEALTALMQAWGVDFILEKKDTYTIVQEKLKPGQTSCSLCSRLRRGHLYGVCRDKGFNKLALGHHLDDVLETFMLNSFFSGKVATMVPGYLNESRDVEVIRPLYAVSEKDIAEFSDLKAWPILPCNLCGSQEDLKRQAMKQQLASLEQAHPGLKQTFFNSLHRVDLNFVPGFIPLKDS